MKQKKSDGSEMIVPYSYSGESKRNQVEQMFDHIAPRYDFLNHFLSAGIDRGWRKKTIDILYEAHPKTILDIATGTADLAIEAMRLKPDKIIGIDISERMLSLGRDKINKLHMEKWIELRKGDSEKLILEDNSFDAVMAAFGVRNFENLEKGLSEIYRVLKPGGMTVILEFSQPTKFPVKQFYNFYSKFILPLIGKIISKDQAAYSYLPESARSFPAGERFTGILSKINFCETRFIPLTFGIATIYIGKK